jgi:MFS family permease
MVIKQQAIADEAVPGGVGLRLGPGALALLSMLAFTTLLSQFFRTSLAVIAPELIQDLGLTASTLGLANGCFFAALLAAQVAVGFAFDRTGPRLTVAILSVLMTAGAIMHAVAPSGEWLVAARVVTGVGCAASFMGSIILISRWFAPENWSMVASGIGAVSQMGILLAGTPLALVTTSYGWRSAFWVAAGLSAICGVLFYIFVRDRPLATHCLGEPEPEPVLGVVDGLRAVLHTPGALRAFALFGVAYASAVTISGLWAGPYLRDVHGLEILERGHVLAAMAIAQTVGILVYGPLDRIFNSRKSVVLFGGSTTLVVLLALTMISHPPLWLAVSLLITMSALASYGTVLLVHVRSHFPDHLAGRGATTGNMAQLAGTAILPYVTGLLLERFPHSGAGYPPAAYSATFGVLAGALAFGLAVYVTSRDIKPRL